MRQTQSAELRHLALGAAHRAGKLAAGEVVAAVAPEATAVNTIASQLQPQRSDDTAPQSGFGLQASLTPLSQPAGPEGLNAF